MRNPFVIRRSDGKRPRVRQRRTWAKRRRAGRFETLELRTLLAAQLQITPVGAPASAVEGSLVDYKFQVQNVGDAAATNVKFSDTLPGGIEFISASTSAGTIAQSSGTVSGSLGNLAPSAIDTVEIRETPTASGTLNNSASASSANAATVNANTTTTATAAGASSPDVQVTGQVAPASAVPGQLMHFTFTVTNNDAQHAAANVVLTDQLPSGAALLGASTDGAGVSAADGVVTARLGTLAAGQTEHVTIDLMATAAGPLSDNAFVTTDSGDPQLANNVASPGITVGSANPSTAANLLVTSTPPSGTVYPGQAAVYTVTVANQGTTTATGVTLFDLLPDGVRYLYSSSNQGAVSEANNMLTMNVGTLAPGASATLTLAVSPLAGGTLSNYAAAASDVGQVNPPTAVATDSLTVNGTPPAQAMLAVTKSDSTGANPTIVPGQSLTYTITVTNQSGTNAASNVLLADPLPAGVAFVSAQSNAGATAGGANLGTVSVIGGSVVDRLGTLAAGASATLTVTVTPTQLGAIDNTAIATTDSGTATDSNLAVDNAVTAVAASASAADLQVTKTDSSGGAAMIAGQQLTYTITLTNHSATNSANDVTLADPLPSGVSYVSSSATFGTVSESNGTVTDHFAVFGPGQMATLTVTVLVGQPGAIQNTAVVTSAEGSTTPSGVVGADTVTAVAAGANGADLSLTDSRAYDNNLVPGEALTYTIRVANNGQTDAAGVIITDSLPSGVVFAYATSTVSTGGGGNQGIVVATGGTVTDNLGTLPAGQTATLTIVVMPTQQATLTNQAAATTASGDINPSNNTASDSVSVGSPQLPVNFLLSQSTTPTTGATQQNLTYHLNVTNNSSNVAFNVVLTDQLPPSMTYLSGSVTTGSVEDLNGYVIAALGTVFPQETIPVTIVVRPTQGGSFTNTLVATTDSGVLLPGNSVNSVNTVISGGGGGGNADLSLSGSGLPDPVNIGANLTYTITVNNTGGSEADSVSLSDPLPSGVSLISESVSQGTVSASGGTVSAQLGRLAAHSSATLTIVVMPSAAGTLTNTVTLGTTTPDAGDGDTVTVDTTVQPGVPPTLCYLPGQPGDGTDATFVRNVYRELLGRDPDSSGQSFWLGFLASGGSSGALGQQHLMVQDFLDSTEYRAHLVDCFYENFLHRAADEGGEQFFVGQLGAGVDPRVVMGEIVGSPEYTGLHGGTSQGFIDALYHDILGRAPDTGGESYWTSQANNPAVPRSAIVEAFVDSPEADRLLLTNATGSALANLTGDGWNTLYFQGGLTQRAQDFFFAQLEGRTPYEDVIRNMLEVGQYYNAADVFLPPTPIQ